MNSGGITGAGGGARRIFHCGNALLSAAVFVVTLALSLVALDPSRSHYVLSDYHRTPSIAESITELMAGFTPLLINAQGHTVAVVPAADTAAGVYDVSRHLRFFFDTPLLLVLGRGAVEKPAHTHAADLVANILRGVDQPSGNDGVADGGHHTAASASRRQINVLHLCTALSCTSPFLVQQWTSRATAGVALRARQEKHAAPSTTSRRRQQQQRRRVNNFALVYGERKRALALQRELRERQIMTASDLDPMTDKDTAMPFVGKWKDLELTALCSAEDWCSYVSAHGLGEWRRLLEVEAAGLSSAAARERLFAGWEARHRELVHSEETKAAPVRCLPTKDVRFGPQYPFATLPVDVVYADVPGDESAALLAYLTWLLETDDKGEDAASRPLHLVFTLYASAWLKEVLQMLEYLVSVQDYAAFAFTPVPLSRQREGGGPSPRHYNTFSEWQNGELRTVLDDLAANPYAPRSHRKSEPLAVVMLSLRITTAAELTAMGTSQMKGNASSHTALEHFFYDSLGLTPQDEEELSALLYETVDNDGEGDGGGGVMQAAAGFLVHYVYFLIPLTMAGVLVWSLCRPRRER